MTFYYPSRQSFSSKVSKKSKHVNFRPRRLLRLEPLEDRTAPSVFSVTNTGDNGGVNPAVGAGTGTLRQAIVDSNAAGGQNTIDFSIGSGQQTISPMSGLPNITASVTIDGTSQPGFAGKPLIELDGANAGNANGLVIVTANCTVTGLVINRFAGGEGVRIFGPGATGNVVEGNYVGLDSTGSFAVGIQFLGIGVDSSAANNIIGGTTAGAGNVISGNVNGVEIGGSGTMGNLVEGNYIGTNAMGSAAVGNSGGVIVSAGATSNTIGGTAAGAGNLISGNSGVGVDIEDTGTSANALQGNLIGTDPTGTAAVPNGSFGVGIGGGPTNNVIGGTQAGAGNTIAFNLGAGVLVGSAATDTTTINNSIRANSIFSNGGLGIDLGEDGVTANHPGGVVAGPNNFQNYPVLVTAFPGSSTAASGTLNALPNATFTLDFYANATPDPSGFGQGQRYLGSTQVVTDVLGNASFSEVTLGASSAGEWLTATATDSAGDTSEFSRAQQLPQKGSSVVVVTSTVNPSIFSATVQFTATVSPVAPAVRTPSGTVAFIDGGVTVLGTAILSAGGTTTFSPPLLSAGSHTITAIYGGDSNFNSSTAAAITQTVNQAASSTMVTSSINPSFFGQSVTFTATVAPNSPATATPTGMVTFMDGAATLATTPLSGGTASFTTTILSVATHVISVSYSGDSNFTASTSSNLLQTVTHRPPFIWTGLGADTNWTDPNNWQGNVAPVAGDDLVFPTHPSGGSAALTPLDNFTAGTSFNSLTIGDSYSFTGNGITLAAGLVVVGNGVPIVTIFFPITLGGDQSFRVFNASSTSTPATTMLTLTDAIVGQGFGLTFDVEPSIGGPATLVSNGGISNIGRLTTLGGGTVILAATNNYSGPTQVDAGTLQVGEANAIPATTAVTVENSATFDLNGFDDRIGSLADSGMTGSTAIVSLGTATLTTGMDNTSTTFAGIIGGTGGLTKIGTGTFTLAGNNTYTGNTTAEGGILSISMTLVSPVVLMGGTVENTAPITVSSFSVPTSGSTFVAMADLTLSGNATLTGQLNVVAARTSTVTITGILSDGVSKGSVIKTGAGILQLNANNTYTGSTVIEGGTALIDGVQPASGVTIMAGATLAGHGTTGSITSMGGIISPGDISTGPGMTAVQLTPAILTAEGDATFDLASTFAVAFTPDGATASQLMVNGTAHLNGANLMGAPHANGAASTTIMEADSLDGNASQKEGDIFFDFGDAGKAQRVHYERPGTRQRITLLVNDTTTVTLSSTINPSSVGQMITLTASVTSDFTSDIPNGFVTFFMGSGSQAAALAPAVSFNAGVAATLMLSSGVSSTTEFTAEFHDFDEIQGFANPSLLFCNSTSSVLTQSVMRGNTTTAVTSSPNPALLGQSVTFMATVTATISSPGQPTGTVTFLDGSTTLGTQTLSSATAAFTTNILGLGSHSIRASYSGDASFSASMSAVLTQMVTATANDSHTRFAVASLYTHSEEHYIDFVSNLYVTILRRAADVSGLQGNVFALYQRQLTDEQVEANFLIAPEYVNRHGGFVLVTPNGSAPGAIWITALYTDILGRIPTDMEVQGWISAMRNGLPALDVASVFVGGVEKETQNIIDAYHTFLGRGPSQDEINNYIDAFQAMTIPPYTIEDLRRDFVFSPEYFSRANKGNNDNATWVRAAYQDVLGRPPSDHEVNDIWVHILAVSFDGSLPIPAAVPVRMHPSGTVLLDVAQVFANSQVHFIDFVSGQYQKYLRRAVDAPGLSGKVDQLFFGQIRDEEITADLLSAPEYVNNHGGFVNSLPGRGWVIGLYTDVLGRNPSESEIQGVLSALAAGQSPFAVAFGFTDSTEKQTEEIVDAFLTLLGRTPSQAEINQYVDAFQHGLNVEELRGDFIGSSEYFNAPAKGNGDNATWVRSAYVERDILFRMANDHEVNDIWVPILEQKQF
jgi:autotransporter-associated beta strand protein